jgi:hypothetical protein
MRSMVLIHLITLIVVAGEYDVISRLLRHPWKKGRGTIVADYTLTADVA